MSKSEYREFVMKLITDSLGSDLTSEQIEDLERGIFNASLSKAKTYGIRRHWENPEYCEVYKTIARRTLGNLIPTTYIQNPRLLERLKEGELIPHDIPFLSEKEMFPENWETLSAAQMKRETAALEGSKEEGCDLFKCRKCGKSRTRYWEMQTRSADEPMTIFIHCLNCGKEWRQ